MTMSSNPVDEATVPRNGASAQDVSFNDNDTNLIRVLTQLAYRKSLIAKTTGIGALVGLVLCIALPVRYTATTKIMPPQQTQSTAAMLSSQLVGLGGGSLAAIAGGGLGLKNPNDIYVGMLTSRTVVDAIIRRFDLASVYHTPNMTKTRVKLGEFTEVTSERNGFIAISVTDKDKKRAADMANEYTDQLRGLTKSLAVTEASQRRLFYEEQLKQTREALVSAALAFQQVQQQKGLIQLDAQAKAMIEGLAEVRAQVAAKQVQVQALRSYSTEKNPSVQLAERELTSLQAEEAHLEQRNPTPGIAGLGLGNVASEGLEYLRAQHELQYQQALFDMLMKQYDAAKIDESKDAAIIQVVEPAIEPDTKSTPHRGRILLQSLIGGFFAGCLLALLQWWKQRMQSDPDRARDLQNLKSGFWQRKPASIDSPVPAQSGQRLQI